MAQLYPTAESTEKDAESHVMACLTSAENGSLVAGSKLNNSNTTTSNKSKAAAAAAATPSVIVGAGDQYVVQTLSKKMEGKECVICFEEMLPGNTIATLSCFCIYHEPCKYMTTVGDVVLEDIVD
jgi:hypothetical protein